MHKKTTTKKKKTVLNCAVIHDDTISKEKTTAENSLLSKKKKKTIDSKRPPSGRSTVHTTAALMHELQVHQIELETQNEELRNAQILIEDAARRFADLYDFAPVGYITTDGDWTIKQANLTISRLLGYANSFLIGKQLHLFVKNEDRDVFSRYQEQLRLASTTQHAEIRLTRKDHTVFYAQLVSAGFSSETVNKKEILVSIIDVTSRKMADMALIESERKYRQLVELAQEGIWALDRDGITTFVNTRMAQMLGYRVEDMVGKRFSVFSGQPNSNIVDQKNDRYNSGRKEQFDVELRRSDGTTIYCSMETGPILSEAGVFNGTLAVVADISQRKKWEDSILELNEKLQVSNRELEVLGHTLSHDLRKPLAGIQEFSTILLDDHSRQLDETGLYLLRQVRQNAFAMEEMITGLLNISRIGLTELRREQINISAAVQTIVDELVREEPNRSVQVTIAENQIVSVDGALVRIFLDNIIRNAWKFTRKQPAGLIEFGVFRQEGGKKTFFLADNGVGFDMEQGDKLFTIFQRLHSSADFEGSGTGLATAQRIIRRHGGDIWAQGQIDKGATIYFNFEK